jgi:hypothetical protein
MTVEERVHLSAIRAALGSVVMFLTDAGVITQRRIDELREDLITSFAATVDDARLTELFRTELTPMMPVASGNKSHLRVLEGGK